MTRQERKFNIFMPFTWFGNNKDTEQRAESTNPRGTSNNRDLSGGTASNEELLVGLYHGTYRGMEKATPLARIPVNVRVVMMGLPTPKSDDERTQEVLNQITAWMKREIKILKWAYLNNGTSWCYPLWDSKAGGLVWRILKDKSVSDIVVSLMTERPVQIVTDENIIMSIGQLQRAQTRKIVKYTIDAVSVSYSNTVDSSVRDVTMKNIAGTLPVKFAHEADDISARGHAINEPVLCDLKDYHDIDTNVSRTVARFKPKQKQTVAKGMVQDWRKNNGLEDDDAFTGYDPLTADLILNQEGEETDYLHLPGDATAAAEKALERIFYKIFQGTNTPQMFFGEIATGNHASSDNDMQIMINEVQSCRDEVTDAFHELYAASMRIMSIVNMETYDEDFTMEWNRLDSISAKDKSEILRNFCQALSAGLSSGAIGISQLYQLWKATYPEINLGTEDEFKAELIKTGNLMQFIKMDYATGETVIGAAGNEADVINKTNKAE